MNENMAKIVFQPSGRRGKVAKGVTILEASRQLGVGIEALCGGKQICGKCKVRIEAGNTHGNGRESGQPQADARLTVESEHISPEERAAGFRLACAATIKDDLLVYVPENSRPGKQVVSKAARPIAIDHDPAVKTFRLRLSKPSLEDSEGDLERLFRFLKRQYGLSALSIDLVALRELRNAMGADKRDLSVSVWMDREIIRVIPGKGAPRYGLAIDVGTTTIAAYLCDLETQEVVETVSMMNPQIHYGEDVISRIEHCYNDNDGLERMSGDVLEGLNALIEQAVEGASKKTGRTVRTDDIEDAAVCGNTCMQHLLLQLDPDPLGRIPFNPANQGGLNIKARDLGLRINTSANVYILPNIAGFIGGDNVGVILVEEPQKSDDTLLVIDIGTNGELVLGNGKRKIFSTCSCATGPALEGAQIAFGMRAAPGAIERVKVCPETCEVDYKVVGREAWLIYSSPEKMETRGICGSAVLDAIAELFKAGVVTGSGAFNPEIETSRLRKNPDTGIMEFVLAWSVETAIGKDVVITQSDIRQVQLAKAAIYTGCKMMLNRFGLEKPDRINIAGAFGAHIDVNLALVLGLFPHIPSERVSAVGNAAGDGCRAALLDRKKREQAERVSRQVEYIELSMMKDFQEHLIEAMHIPHMKDPFPEPGKKVLLE